MDDRLLMGVLDALANPQKQSQTLGRAQPVLIAVVGDRSTRHVLHDKKRPSTRRGAGIVHTGDAGMVHQGEGLPLGLEPGDHLAGVHAGLDDLERHRATYRFQLLGPPHLPHTTLANLFQQAIGPDPFTGPIAGSAIFGEEITGGHRLVIHSFPANRGEQTVPRFVDNPANSNHNLGIRLPN